MPSSQFQIKIGVDAAGVTAGINKAVQTVQRLTHNLQSVKDAGQKAWQTLSGNIVVSAIRTGFQFITGELDAMKEKLKDIQNGVSETGLSFDEFQRVKTIVEKTNSSVDQAGKVLESLAESLEKARKGNVELITNYAQLGITLDDIKSKNHKQVFFQLADAMKRLELTQERLNALQKVGGGKAPDLMPAFRKGFDTQEANRGILTDEDRAKMKEAINDSETLKGIWANIKTEATLFALKLPLIGNALSLSGAAKAARLFQPGDDKEQMDQQEKLQDTLNGKLLEKARKQAEKAAQDDRGNKAAKASFEISQKDAERVKKTHGADEQRINLTTQQTRGALINSQIATPLDRTVKAINRLTFVLERNTKIDESRARRTVNQPMGLMTGGSYEGY